MSKDTREVFIKTVAIVSIWAGVALGITHGATPNYIGWGLFVTFLIATS